MESSYKSYDFHDSVSRIDEILDSPAGNYEERDSIPSRTNLTFTNGYYVNCTCIFMDIKGSSQLPQKHQRPRLAKIYRSFISESVAVLNGSTLCSEVNIHGDAVWAVYESQYKNNIDSAFSTCAQLSSLVKILNCRLRKRSIETISVGIGADWGRALMIKAGYKGSGINDVVWMGDVVNGGANMCKKAKEVSYQESYICVSETFFGNLNEDNPKKKCYRRAVGDTEAAVWSTQQWMRGGRKTAQTKTQALAITDMDRGRGDVMSLCCGRPLQILPKQWQFYRLLHRVDSVHSQ